MSEVKLSLKDAMETMRLVLTGQREATTESRSRNQAFETSNQAFETIVAYLNDLEREEDPFLPREVVLDLLMIWTRTGLRKLCWIIPPLNEDPRDITYCRRVSEFAKFQGQLFDLAEE